MNPLPEVQGPLTRQQFEHELLPRQAPVVLRGQVADWPLVQAAQQGDAALTTALSAMASDAEVDALMLAPQHRGRIFYGDGFLGFNYLRNRLPLRQVIAQVQRYAQFERAPAVAVQSAPAAECAPGFVAGHLMPLLDERAAPRLWFGTAIVTPTHFDESANIASVVAGQRRFTLFAPDQVGNLSVGPIGNAPTGTPISLVDLDNPDLKQHPRFALALQAAQQAVLAPGDAIYIPPLWWHHVVSLRRVNLLVNYWWKAAPDAPSALDALLHTMMALGALPADQRRAWQTLFAHWVFEADAASTAHLPAALLGVHGAWTPALREQVRQVLQASLRAP